ncbi:SRPBCC domain-containing protein [Microbacterium sp. MYb62]|uniref:SRPBCC domain-containing protein n=1 Tax=Microbacterium sp. MYb62 TaxID=1848690 RepID=UPI000CFBB336|nr:SRPBCC domain-containing protein [Microbacterium sp. MYb62]PRB14113.1 hypothetical protein CQ042_11535 [Microbacterium sp. MYb62]
MAETSGGAGSALSHSELSNPVRHAEFTISRRLATSRATVFSAFESDEIRRRWIRLPGREATYRHDFRVGGGEDARSTFLLPDGTVEQIRNRSHYLEIVPSRRIVFAYEALVDAAPRWISLVTVTFLDNDLSGCDLVWTEQVAFLTQSGDGSADLPHLRTGTALRLNGLPVALGVEGSVR